MSHKGNKLQIGWSKVKYFSAFLLIICEREEWKLMQKHKLVFEQRGISFITMVSATFLFNIGKNQEIFKQITLLNRTMWSVS